MNDIARMMCLASKSVGRRMLLDRGRVRSKFVSPDVPEQRQVGESPRQFVSRLSKEKAERGLELCPEADVIVGADTIVLLGSEIIGKPPTHQEAVQILSRLQNRTHDLITGLTVIRNEDCKVLTVVEESKVTLTEMSVQQIEQYVRAYNPFYLAGGYEIDGIAAAFIERIEGSPTNVIGLPMRRLRLLIEDLGFSWFDFVDPLNDQYRP